MKPVVMISPEKSSYYSDFVNKLAKPMGGFKLDLVHGALGVCGEAGELADAIKKCWAYGKELDKKNVIEELGDLRFYMQLIMNKLEISDSDILQANCDKLSIRYREGYTDQAAIDRADKKFLSEDQQIEKEKYMAMIKKESK